MLSSLSLLTDLLVVVLLPKHYFLWININFFLFSFNRKQHINPQLENGNELKRFKICAVCLRIRLFWIYTTITFFKKNLSPLLIYVLKILSIKKKKKKTKTIIFES